MPSTFRIALDERTSNPAGRRWLFIPYDQLTDALGPLSREDPAELGIVLVESPAKAALRPYHRQKLALVLANLRHFALEQAERGVAVRHLVSPGGYAEALTPIANELGPIRMMEAAELELRAELEPLVREGHIDVLPHEGWLTARDDFREGAGLEPPWRMDAFYRRVRQRTGILMDDDSPVGGRYSFDTENRKAWKGEPPPAVPPAFEPDPVTHEVITLIEDRFSSHPGTLRPEALPATRHDAEALWAWAREACLPQFGPYEDAMSVQSSTLFHTRISGLLNLHRLTPKRVIDDTLALDIPLASKEGFVRQILGWREFVRHVHVETEGFRGIDRFLEADRPLPDAWWGAASGMHCLDHVVERVWEEGYGHHITRLMVLSNLATLLDTDPRALTDWFWVAYTDAYDWVVEPNVLAMGTFAVGDLMTTKPYVSGTPYIRRMSDFCDHCALDPDKSCPISELYWAFLARHRERLAGNRRLALPLAQLERRGDERRATDARIFSSVRAALEEGTLVTPSLVDRARAGVEPGS